MEQPGYEIAPTWDAGILGSSLTPLATMSVPSLLLPLSFFSYRARGLRIHEPSLPTPPTVKCCFFVSMQLGSILYVTLLLYQNGIEPKLCFPEDIYQPLG